MNFVFYAFIAIIALAVLRRIRQALSLFTPPPRIHLVRAKATGAHAQDIAARGRELEACGFRAIGTFQVNPMRGVLLTAFSHPGESLCAIVYRHPIVGCFVDVVSKNEADHSFTATTAPAGKELDRREGQEKVFDRNLTIPAMVALVLEKRPSGPWQAWTAANFAAKFEESYAKEMDWRASRGGVTSDEVRRFADASGRKVSDGDVLKATHILQRKYAESRRDVR